MVEGCAGAGQLAGLLATPTIATAGREEPGKAENWGQDQPPFRDTPKPVLGFTASVLGFVAAALGFVVSALGLGRGGALFFSKRKIGS